MTNTMTNMTVQERDVFQAFENLVDPNDTGTSSDTTTTLDIKLYLRKHKNTQGWYQSDISAIMDKFYSEGLVTYSDNGTYREYGLMPQVNTVPVVNAFQIAGPPVSVATVVPASSTVDSTLTPNPNAVVTPSASLPKVYRTASGRKSEFQPVNEKKIGILAAIDMFKKASGKFFTVLFTKTDGTERIMNCQYVSDQVQHPLGYILMVDMALKSRNNKDAQGNPDHLRNVNTQTLLKFKMDGQYYEIVKK